MTAALLWMLRVALVVGVVVYITRTFRRRPAHARSAEPMRAGPALAHRGDPLRSSAETLERDRADEIERALGAPLHRDSTSA